MSDGTWGLPGVTHWDGCGEIGTPEHEGCFISMEHQSAPPPERAILTDLIAELRHRHTPYRVCMECDDWYAGCEDHEHITVCLWCCTSHGYHSMDCADNHTGTTLAEHCVTVGMADRAEARLREVQGE